MFVFWLHFHWSVFLRVDMINSKLVSIHLMAWHWTGAKPLSGPMMTQLTNKCITRPQLICVHSFCVHWRLNIVIFRVVSVCNQVPVHQECEDRCWLKFALMREYLLDDYYMLMRIFVNWQDTLFSSTFMMMKFCELFLHYWPLCA